jgi:hypothetical protein
MLLTCLNVLALYDNLLRLMERDLATGHTFCNMYAYPTSPTPRRYHALLAPTSKYPPAALTPSGSWLQAYNFVSGSAGVFLFPYLNLYLAQRGLSSAQIGLLAALRTWLAAPVSLAATATSDRYKLHKQLLLVASITSCGLRSSLPLVGGTGMLFAALLLADLLGAPVGVLADSAVLSNCNEVRASFTCSQARLGARRLSVLQSFSCCAGV